MHIYIYAHKQIANIHFHLEPLGIFIGRWGARRTGVLHTCFNLSYHGGYGVGKVAQMFLFPGPISIGIHHQPYSESYTLYPKPYTLNPIP